jgi:hypothetical protein
MLGQSDLFFHFSKASHVTKVFQTPLVDVFWARLRTNQSDGRPVAKPTFFVGNVGRGLMVVGELMEEVEAYSKHLKTTQLLQMFFFSLMVAY